MEHEKLACPVCGNTSLEFLGFVLDKNGYENVPAFACETCFIKNQRFQ